MVSILTPKNDKTFLMISPVPNKAVFWITLNPIIIIIIIIIIIMYRFHSFWLEIFLFTECRLRLITSGL